MDTNYRQPGQGVYKFLCQLDMGVAGSDCVENVRCFQKSVSSLKLISSTCENEG
jgi:hypothetical protein